MGASSDPVTIINTEQTPCSLHWSFERPKSKMKLSLIITLTVAAVSYASPLQSNLDTSSAETTEHQRMRRSANGCPYQVKVQYASGEDPDSGPYKLWKKYYGTYTIQNGHIGARDWYLSSNGKYAIWYYDGEWVVGQEHKKGTKWRAFSNLDDHKCPHQPAFNWQYWYQPLVNGLMLIVVCPFIKRLKEDFFFHLLYHYFPIFCQMCFIQIYR